VLPDFGADDGGAAGRVVPVCPGGAGRPVPLLPDFGAAGGGEDGLVLPASSDGDGLRPVVPEAAARCLPLVCCAVSPVFLSTL